ncbi:MAG: nicotinamide-nucleotide amidohydrolase family protein [Selenomonas sp.]|nr:nicotinamide-nucleotide amidohydrolase family protein [Selenomonas sp.]
MSVSESEKASVEARLGSALKALGLTIACAESCTGGLVTSRLTDIAGSSAYVMGSIVSYSNEVKEKLVGVQHATLAAHGAVSEETAREMAKGVRRAVGTDVGLATTGIAGPGGGTAEKPVGLVYTAASGPWGTVVRENHFHGTRIEVKRQASETVLAMALTALSDMKQADQNH